MVKPGLKEAEGYGHNPHRYQTIVGTWWIVRFQ